MFNKKAYDKARSALKLNLKLNVKTYEVDPINSDPGGWSNGEDFCGEIFLDSPKQGANVVFIYDHTFDGAV